MRNVLPPVISRTSATSARARAISTLSKDVPSGGKRRFSPELLDPPDCQQTRGQAGSKYPPPDPSLSLRMTIGGFSVESLGLSVSPPGLYTVARHPHALSS